MRNNTVQQEEVRGMAVLDHVPEGWKVVGGCTNAPAGYRFINNNKSRFGGEYKHALVKEDVAIATDDNDFCNHAKRRNDVSNEK